MSEQDTEQRIETAILRKDFELKIIQIENEHLQNEGLKKQLKTQALVNMRSWVVIILMVFEMVMLAIIAWYFIN